MRTKTESYLRWLASETPTAWWHDSADPDEISAGLADEAVGVTTNPLLIKHALYNQKNPWAPMLATVPKDARPEERAEEIIRRITVSIAGMFEPVYRRSGGAHGYVCAQVNPRFPGDRGQMLAMARRLSGWAPNIAVKLPATAAGLDVLEDAAAEGMTITATVSFTVPQVVSVAERHEKGLRRARASGVKAGRCFAVIMVGRIDDYLRDVAHDRKAGADESDITMAGTAIMKRAYKIFKEKKYRSVLMPAGMRGAYHATALSGGDLVLSIHPKIQSMISRLSGPFTKEIDADVDRDIVRRLETIPEFVRAYEPDGMEPDDFITYGAVQKTLSQFVDAGWANIEQYAVHTQLD